jgi:predicted RND superfamily exporter protein
MRRLLRFSTENPRTVVAAVAVITLAACLFIPRVRLQLDGRSLIPAGEPALEASDRAAAVFGLRDVVVIGVSSDAPNIYNARTLACIARLSEAVSHVSGVAADSVTSLATMPRLYVDNEKIDARPLLVMGRQPDQETVCRVQRETEALGLNDGVLVSRDGRAAAIFAEVTPEADRYEVLRQVRELVAKESRSESYRVHLSGTALAQAVLGEAAARDLVKLIPAVIIVLAAVLTLAFRHPSPAVISLTEIGASLLITVGLMGMTGQSVFVTTLVMPVILIAVGVSDDVYALTHFFDESQKMAGRPVGEVVLSAFGGVSRSIAITAASTMIGLLSIAMTSLEPLRVFGTFGAAAILFSSLFTFTLVPAMIVLMNVRARRPSAARKQGGKRGTLMLLRLLTATGPRRILLIALTAAAFALLLTVRLRVDDSWVKNLPTASDIAQGDKELNRLMAGTITLDLMLDSNLRDGFSQPNAMSSLARVEEAIASLPTVGAVHSIYSDVARVIAALRGRSYWEFRDALRRGEIRLDSGDIEQALLLLSSVRRMPLTDRIDEQHRRARLTVFIRSADYERIHSVLETASAAGLSLLRTGGVLTPFGDGWISYLTVRILVRGQVWSIGLGLLADLALLSLLLRSVKNGVVAILPVAFSLLVVFAVLAATETPLGIANSMFAGIAIGIGLDFSIHLTSAYCEGVARGLVRRNSLKRAFISTGAAIITSALAITAGFSALALSEVLPNMQLGLMICLSLLVCAAATLLLVPSIVLSRRHA